MFAGLHDKIAVVTGSDGRLGRVWSRALREAGAHVLGLDLPGYDVRQRGDLDRAAAMIVGADLLVLAAGIDAPPSDRTWELDMSFGPRMKELPPTAQTVLETNVGGVIRSIEAFLPGMITRGGGAIVTIGSLYASVAPDPSLYAHLPGFDKPPAYGASKAGVVELTRYYAVRLARHNIRVNCLSPGGVRNGQDETFQAAYASHVPLGRMAEPDDLIGPLLFLASDASRYVTGHELRVDGGFTAL